MTRAIYSLRIGSACDWSAASLAPPVNKSNAIVFEKHKVQSPSLSCTRTYISDVTDLIDSEVQTPSSCIFLFICLFIWEKQGNSGDIVEEDRRYIGTAIRIQSSFHVVSFHALINPVKERKPDVTSNQYNIYWLSIIRLCCTDVNHVQKSQDKTEENTLHPIIRINGWQQISTSNAKWKSQHYPIALLVPIYWKARPFSLQIIQPQFKAGAWPTHQTKWFTVDSYVVLWLLTILFQTPNEKKNGRGESLLRHQTCTLLSRSIGFYWIRCWFCIYSFIV